MRIILPGGSGQVGTLLARAFHGDGHEVVVLSRSPRPEQAWKSVRWDARTPGDWCKELEGSDAVINLAGRSVNCRYTPANREAILKSRVDSTQVLREALAQSRRPPKVWLQSSTATIYAHRFDAPNDEDGMIGGSEPGIPDTWRFSIDVATAWENAAAQPLPQTRTVLLRSAMVMSPDRGGVFDLLLRLVRFGLGGQAGSGRQFVSWIHEVDFVRAIYLLIEKPLLSGPVNLASPNPLPNAEFMRCLRDASGMPIGLPAAEWMLEIGALGLRTETELVLKSRRVVPGKLLEDGFRFEFPQWQDASRDLYARWRSRS